MHYTQYDWIVHFIYLYCFCHLSLALSVSHHFWFRVGVIWPVGPFNQVGMTDFFVIQSLNVHVLIFWHLLCIQLTVS